MSDTMRSLLFSAVLCLVCSLLLTTAATGLKGYQQQNVELDRRLNLLKSVNLVTPEGDYSAEDIRRRYDDNIDEIHVDRSGRVVPEASVSENDLPVYLYQDGGDVKAYIIPINTRGLWGKIKGYLALESDGATVAGFTVYQHSETPGLGGEIEQRWFQDNFVGKKIVGRYGDFVSVGIAKGEVESAVPDEKQLNYVDGISGATLTGRFLTAGLKNILSAYEPVSIQFRGQRMLRMPAGNPDSQEP
jgi:Na+-transporting NADH:ubiquinone oxidoreductase subunit C